MKTLVIKKNQLITVSIPALIACIIGAILLSSALPYLFSSSTVIGFVDAGIWQLLLIAFVAWAISFWLSATVLHVLLERLGLPTIFTIVEHFNKLTPWQKLKSYFLLFVALLGSVGLTIAAVI